MKWILLVSLGSVLTLRGGDSENWWRVFGEVEVGNFSGGGADSEKELDEETKKLLASRRFDEWAVFEDDLVRISYPKHDLLKMTVNGGDKGIKVEGGVCTTVDNSFQRAYVLKAGDATYGVFLVAKADWLDDGICLCGPMVHHVYQIRNGCLLRYSLLPGGAVKKAQMLGGQLRLMSFEWTHLACQREIYEEMVQRMVLKTPSKLSEDELREETFRQYGLEGRAGWLHPGMGLADAASIMGAEPEQVDGVFRWTGVLNDYPCELKVRFENGNLRCLENEGVNRTGEDAVKGSTNWVSDRIDQLRKLRGDEKQSAKPSSQELDELAEAIIGLAEQSKPDDIWHVTTFMQTMVEEFDRKDPRFVDFVLKRGVGNEAELMTLKGSGYNDMPAWFESKLAAMRSESPSKRESSGMFDDPFSSRARDAAALMKGLAEVDPAKATKSAIGLLDTGKVAWTLAVVLSLNDLDDGIAQDVIERSLQLALKEQSGELVEAVFESLETASIVRPESIKELIGRLPNGEARGEWENTKEKALKTLGQKKPRGEKD